MAKRMSSRDISPLFFRKTTAAVDAGLRELAVFGEEEDLGLRWIEAGNDDGG